MQTQYLSSDTQDNPYAAPQADLRMDGDKGADFYVVSIQKFTVLFVATLGIYSVYWFYKNWQCYKDKHNTKMWPIARGIFSIFFAHKLFAAVEAKLSSMNEGGTWQPASVATLYVVASIVSNILDRLAQREVGSPYTDLVSIAMLIPVFLAMRAAQRKINVSQKDADGVANSQFTAANWLWVAIGLLLWLLVLFGYALYYPPFAEWFLEMTVT